MRKCAERRDTEFVKDIWLAAAVGIIAGGRICVSF